jgi:hypothetical protein
MGWSGYDVCCELGKTGLDGRRYIYNVAVTGPSPTFVTRADFTLSELFFAPSGALP